MNASRSIFQGMVMKKNYLHGKNFISGFCAELIKGGSDGTV